MKHDDRYKKYIEYIKNTKMDRVPVEIFDDDWEPVGEMVRRDMHRDGVININRDGIELI